MISLDNNSFVNIPKQIAARVKTRRLEMCLTQEGLAERAGVKLPTYRQFERTGKIALESLVKIAFALNALDDFNVLFAHRQYNSIQEVIDEESNKTLKRGKIK